MSQDDLIKYEGGLIKQVNNAISITSKLLTADLQLIPYRKGNKWGFCTPDKKIVIDCVYDNIEPFLKGLAHVEKDGKDFFINKAGNIIVDIEKNA